MAETKFPLALVTGAAHRLGRAFAVTLARTGYAILLHFHSSAEVDDAAEEIRSLGVPVHPFQADLTDADDIDRLFAFADTLPYTLKVLVNSAAVMQRAPIQDLTAEIWDSTLDLNLRAPFLMAQKAAKRMKAGGLIVNISDAGAKKTWTGYPSYIMSKAAVESLTRHLARAFSPSIRVNGIAPGLVLPVMDFPGEEWQRMVERLPLKKNTPVEDVTSTLEFLIKNESVTGQTIVVDGGYSLI